MSDLIYRQAAVDVAMEYGKKIPPYAIRVKKAIEQLPPAQPDIVRCKDCKYWEQVLYDIGKCLNVRRDVVVWWGADDYCSRSERKDGEADG